MAVLPSKIWRTIFMDENKKDKRKNIIILILVLIIALGGFFLFNRKEDDKPLNVDTEQSSYVKPETPCGSQ